jgi:hypothetical protein
MRDHRHLAYGRRIQLSYMRGPCYVWRDDNRVHVWAEDGYDGWDETSWAEGRKHADIPSSTPSGGASGVGVLQESADAYVVMRLAELVCEQRIGAVIESGTSETRRCARPSARADRFRTGSG